MLDHASFANHIRIKDKITKDERARRLYEHYNYDLALPYTWVEDMAKVTGVDTSSIVSEFVWMYATIHTGPAPLSLRACEWLRIYEENNNG